MANGSLKELETLLIGTVFASYVPETRVDPLLSRADSVGRLLSALQRRLRQRADGRP
ncbi:MAG: hypothetical protein M3081_17890 [Gemmatimonadota bacterium]|nr:hypothetical protein [Gemmatimonadota bacterium]